MRKYSVTYEKRYTREFHKRAKKYRSLKNQIEKKINLLIQNPYHNCKSELLTQDLKGLRSARLTESIRIIFAICEECRRRNWQKKVGCTPSLCRCFRAKTVVFLSLGTHDEVYG